MEESFSDNIVINLPQWTSRATLGAIGGSSHI